MPEADPLTIEERFTRDLARRQAIIATQYGGDEDAYLDHFFSELKAEYNPSIVVAERPKLPRPSLSEKQARRAARKARRYADPRAFPSFRKEPTTWKCRKADRMIYHQAPSQIWHFCARGQQTTRFIAGVFDSKLWMADAAGHSQDDQRDRSVRIWVLPKVTFGPIVPPPRRVPSKPKVSRYFKIAMVTNLSVTQALKFEKVLQKVSKIAGGGSDRSKRFHGLGHEEQNSLFLPLHRHRPRGRPKNGATSLRDDARTMDGIHDREAYCLLAIRQMVALHHHRSLQ